MQKLLDASHLALAFYANHVTKNRYFLGRLKKHWLIIDLQMFFHVHYPEVITFYILQRFILYLFPKLADKQDKNWYPMK